MDPRLPDEVETNARVRVKVDDVDKGTRRALNWISGVSATDDPVNEKVDLDAFGGAGAACCWHAGPTADAAHGAPGDYEYLAKAVLLSDGTIAVIFLDNQFYHLTLSAPFSSWFTTSPAYNPADDGFPEVQAQGMEVVVISSSGAGGQLYDRTTDTWDDGVDPINYPYAWQTLFQGSDEIFLQYCASCVDPNGRMWIVGNRQNGADADPRIALATGTGYRDAGSLDWIRVADLPAGDGGDYSIEAHSMCVDSQGRLYVGGGSDTTVVNNRFRRYTAGPPVDANIQEVQHVVSASIDSYGYALPIAAFSTFDTIAPPGAEEDVQAFIDTILGPDVAVVSGDGNDHTVTWVEPGVRPLFTRTSGIDVTITRETPGGGYPSTDSWEELDVIPDTALYRGVMVVDDQDRVYYIGGADGGGTPVGTAYRYTPDDGWETLAALPTDWVTTSVFETSGESQPGFFRNGKIYIVGYTVDQTQTGLLVYDIASNIWDFPVVCHTPHERGATIIASGRMWAICGADPTGPTRTNVVEWISV